MCEISVVRFRAAVEISDVDGLVNNLSIEEDEDQVEPVVSPARLCVQKAATNTTCHRRGSLFLSLACAALSCHGTCCHPACRLRKSLPPSPLTTGVDARDVRACGT